MNSQTRADVRSFNYTADGTRRRRQRLEPSRDLSQLMAKRPRIERLPFVADSTRDHDDVRSMARAIEAPPMVARCEDNKHGL